MNRTWARTSGIAALGALILSASPTLGDGRSGFSVSAWVDMDAAQERKAVAACGRSLDRVALFNFSIGSSGGFAEGALRGEAAFIRKVHARGGSVSITFIDWVGSARDVVDSEALTARFARTVARACVEQDVDAVDIDFERLGRARRDRFTRFCRMVARELHAVGKRLTVAVLPKTNAAGEAEGSQDLAALGQAVDALEIMAYDYSGPWSGAGPIGPLDWARRVIDHAVSRGVPRSKIVLGVALYGRVWPGGQNVSSDRAEAIARSVGARIQHDPETGEAHFSGGGRTGWFCDEASVAAKVRFARSQGLGGVALFSMSWARDGVLESVGAARTEGRGLAGRVSGP